MSKAILIRRLIADRSSDAGANTCVADIVLQETSALPLGPSQNVTVIRARYSSRWAIFLSKGDVVRLDVELIFVLQLHTCIWLIHRTRQLTACTKVTFARCSHFAMFLFLFVCCILNGQQSFKQMLQRSPVWRIWMPPVCSLRT